MLNYLIVEHVQTFFVCILYRFHKERQSLGLICISAAELTFMEEQENILIPFLISKHNEQKTTQEMDYHRSVKQVVQP